MKRWLFLVALLAAHPAQALDQALNLSGSFVQGGLVVGHVNPGSLVTLDGQKIDVAINGAFVFGFGRDAAESVTLAVLGPDGREEKRQLAIARQSYDIQRIDGLPERKVTPRPEDLERIKKDNADIAAVRAHLTMETPFLSGFAWPVQGPLSGVFGSQRILNGEPRNPHNGVDVAAPISSLIVAPADGRVALVANDMFYTGKTLMIDHGLGLTSVYAHMDEIAVKPGQALKKGDPIGTVGQTGRATGAHRHWGLTWKGVHLDPGLAAGPMPHVQPKG